MAEEPKEPMNNFTPRAQQVLALARKEADRFHHNYVGTEHILLGLIKLGQGVAVSVLQKMGLDLETVRSAVEKQVGTGQETKPQPSIPFTPRVKKVLALAGKEAKALNHSYVGTEHILLGLLREEEGLAARVLESLDITVEEVRAQVARIVIEDMAQGTHQQQCVIVGVFPSCARCDLQGRARRCTDYILPTKIHRCRIRATAVEATRHPH